MNLKTFEEKTLEMPEYFIHSRKDGIVHVVFKEKVELDVDLQERMMEVYIKICAGEKRPFMFSAFNDVNITKEARDNSKKLEDRYPGSATAVIANSLSYTLIANFYLKVNKPKTPYKVFKDIPSAEFWLKKFIE